jgi:hypothetical protein
VTRNQKHCVGFWHEKLCVMLALGLNTASRAPWVTNGDVRTDHKDRNVTRCTLMGSAFNQFWTVGLILIPLFFTSLSSGGIALVLKLAGSFTLVFSVPQCEVDCGSGFYSDGKVLRDVRWRGPVTWDVTSTADRVPKAALQALCLGTVAWYPRRDVALPHWY